jgi:thiol-disulfide isomerase/thioredoxin
MNKRYPTFILFTFLLISLTILSACSGDAKKSGNGVPDYSQLDEEEAIEQAVFEGLNDELVSVESHQGKVIMLDFWETWCKPCINSFPTLNKLVEEYPDDFVVLAVTPGFMNEKSDAIEFAGNHDYNFIYAMDTGLAQKLSIQSIPYKVFVDADGNYLSTKIGSYGPERDYEEIKKIIEKHRK